MAELREVVRVEREAVVGDPETGVPERQDLIDLPNTLSSGGFLKSAPQTGFEQKSQENGQPLVTIILVCFNPTA